MLEGPEMATIARQMQEALPGNRVAECVRGNTEHKWAWYNLERDEYEALAKGKEVGEVRHHGKWIYTAMEPGHTLVLGEMGGRINFHEDDKSIPKKHHLLFRFEDDTYLTVAMRMWAFMGLHKSDSLGQLKYAAKQGEYPLSDAFTFDYFQGLFDDEEIKPKTSVKKFVISTPGVCGVGNGYLQDILFHAKLHPKHLLLDMTDDHKLALYDATRAVFTRATDLRGMDTECDFFGQPGGYVRILDTRTKGQPCTVCGAPIEKISYLGGSCYLCPSCQT